MERGRIRLAVVNQRGAGGATAAAREVLAWGPGRGFEVRYFPNGDGGDAARLLRELESFRPDVVHVHCWYQTYPYDHLREIASRHLTIFTVHDVAVINQYGTECWECYRNPWCLGCPALGALRRWRPNYRIFDRRRKRRTNRATHCHLIYPSEWMRRRLARSEWKRLPSTVIPYGVDTEAFKPGPARRSTFDLPDGPVVLFAGNMYSAEDHRKGLPDLIEAFASVRLLVPTATLVIAGQVEGIRSGPGRRVLGEIPRERLPDLYRSADLFCLPSRGDNLPVAVLEAMACGIPVVGSRVGGVPEQVLEGTTGLLTPPNAPADLSDALAQLLSDPGERRAMSRASRLHVENRFSRSVSADLHEGLYRHLVGRGS